MTLADSIPEITAILQGKLGKAVTKEVRRRADHIARRKGKQLMEVFKTMADAAIEDSKRALTLDFTAPRQKTAPDPRKVAQIEKLDAQIAAWHRGHRIDDIQKIMARRNWLAAC